MKRKKNFTEKPNNRCLFCPKRTSDPPECNGPRTGSMTTDRWREYMRDIKEVDGLTFKEIAARTNGMMSADSIQNTLAPGATRDLTRETARIIENAIFGVAVASPCPIDLLECAGADSKTISDLKTELDELRRGITSIHDSYAREMDSIRAEAQQKVDYLKDENQWLRKMIEHLQKK